MVPVGDSLSEHLDAAARMTDFTDEDVERGHEYFCGIPECDGCRDTVGGILAAVLPEHDKRVRAEVLREAGDVWDSSAGAAYRPIQIAQWLRARADDEEGN